MFDQDDFETLYQALGEAIDALLAEAESASELGESQEVEEAIAAKIAAYETLRGKLHPLVIE